MDNHKVDVVLFFLSQAETLIRRDDQSLFDHQKLGELDTAIQEFDRIDEFFLLFQELGTELKGAIESLETWQDHYYQWQILLARIHVIAEDRKQQNTASEAADSDSAEDEDGEDVEEEEEEGGELAQAGRRFNVFARKISYQTEMEMAWFKIREKDGFREAYGTYIVSKTKAENGWVWVRAKIKSASELIGLGSILFGVLWLMEISPIFNHLIRVIGTIVLMAVALFMVVWPLYRLSQNPMRIVKIFAGLLGIKIPTDEEEG